MKDLLHTGSQSLTVDKLLQAIALLDAAPVPEPRWIFMDGRLWRRLRHGIGVPRHGLHRASSARGRKRAIVAARGWA